MKVKSVRRIQRRPSEGAMWKRNLLSFFHVKSFPIMFAYSFISGRHCFDTTPADTLQFAGGARLPAIHNKLVSIFWHTGSWKCDFFDLFSPTRHFLIFHFISSPLYASVSLFLLVLSISLFVSSCYLPPAFFSSTLSVVFFTTCPIHSPLSFSSTCPSFAVLLSLTPT